jgi:HAE1 family hydrophobic/amphiphilic exporter-1/multidrug efflux pump
MVPPQQTIDISKSFYEQFEALKKTFKDIKLNIALDNTIFVKKSVLEVADIRDESGARKRTKTI